MKTWSFYRTGDGGFLDRTYSAKSDRDLERNTPPGTTAIEGAFDPVSQRVHLATGEVVTETPRPPDADHEWHAEQRRFRLTPAAAERLAASQDAMAAITAQEASLGRATRELLLSPAVRSLFVRPEDLANLQRLQAGEEEIVKARRSIQKRGS